MQFYLRIHSRNAKRSGIAWISHLPDLEKHWKYHVFNNNRNHEIATTTRSVPDPAGCFCRVIDEVRESAMNNTSWLVGCDRGLPEISMR